MIKISHISFFCLLIITIGCQKQIDFGGSDFVPEIVLNSVFTPDSLWIISLASTENIFDESSRIEPIVDATILLEDRNTGDEILINNHGDGTYSSKGAKPQEGHLYEIFVQAPGYKQVSAVSYVPSIPEVEITAIEQHNIDGNPVFEVNMEIKDDGNEQNYYIWEIVKKDPDNIKDSRGQVYNGSNLETLKQKLTGDAAVGSLRRDVDKLLFLSDSGFNGSVHNASFFAIPPDDNISETADTPGQGPIVDPNAGGDVNYLVNNLSIKVRAVSSDLFEHIKSLEEYKSSSTSSTNLKNGANIFSNVDNGLGIFGAFTLTHVEI
jgi:hypothetical protein